MSSWLWNLVPLGIVKFFAREHGIRVACRIGPDQIPFYVHGIAGVLVRSTPNPQGESK